MIVTILMLIYQIAAIVICFYAYREFKGMLYDHQGGGASIMPGINASRGNSYQRMGDGGSAGNDEER
jgi:hypothetical protein